MGFFTNSSGSRKATGNNRGTTAQSGWARPMRSDDVVPRVFSPLGSGGGAHKNNRNTQGGGSRPGSSSRATTWW